MAIDITRPGKHNLQIATAVMPAAGTFGFGDRYRKLLDIRHLGALVTNPVSLQARAPARSGQAVPLDAGLLLHTGLPNPGLRKVLGRYRQLWASLPLPVILHLIGSSPRHIAQACQLLDEVEELAAVELGLPDDCELETALEWLQAAAQLEKPLLLRLPFSNCEALALPLAEAGADALVVAAPPRGTVRAPQTGRLVSGRVYGPLVKPLVLRMLGRLRREIPPDLPIIGCGGIHSPQDARDYLEAGAVAVQVDSATWLQPKMLERIARDLGGRMPTRQVDALLDEWHPDMGQTAVLERRPPAPQDD